jgi:hypothetical protein
VDKECIAIVELLNPFQIGVGVVGEAEAIVHATNMLHENINCETHVEVDLDLQNAYGCCLRQTAINSIVNKLPGVVRFVAAVYLKARHLYNEDYVFLLTSGIDQGDPLGGLLFSLTLHAFFLKVHNIIPDLQLNAW